MIQIGYINGSICITMNTSQFNTRVVGMYWIYWPRPRAQSINPPTRVITITCGLMLLAITLNITSCVFLLLLLLFVSKSITITITL